MKTKIVLILLIVIASIIAFSFGKAEGNRAGFNEAKRIDANQPIQSLREQLRQREIAEITSFIHGKASINRIDEGKWFNINYVYYFEGSLSNAAAIAKAKDIKIKLDFISKTGSKIESKELTIYDYVNPGNFLNFKEKIDLPENYEKLEFFIIGANGE